MQKVKLSLIDNDYVVHATTELTAQTEESAFLGIIRHLDEDFIHGEKAYLEIEGLDKGPIRLEVSQLDA